MEENQKIEQFFAIASKEDLIELLNVVQDHKLRELIEKIISRIS